MSASSLLRTFVLRVFPFALLAAAPIFSTVSPALAATKAVAPDPAYIQNKTKPFPAAAVKNMRATGTAGALRILLVDDDRSDNNFYPGDSRQSPSDRIFLKLIADAVGGDTKAWSVESVKPYGSGPGIDRLRPYSLALWYTGSNYGGNPDNSAVLSIEDEKTVRRYLEEVGGTVILISPGYLSKVHSPTYGDTAIWPFLSEVLGVRGGAGLAQRFEPGTVKASDGESFNVGKGSATVETQFSTLIPQNATVLFTAMLNKAKKSDAPSPVATAATYGKGRIIYVGFTFENLADADLKPAFNTLLAATGLQQNSSATASAALATVKPQAISVTGNGQDRLKLSPSNTRANKVPVKSRGDPVTIHVVYSAPTPSEVTCSAGLPPNSCNSIASSLSSYSAISSASSTLTFNLDSAQRAVNGSYDVSSSLSGTIWDNYQSLQSPSSFTAIAIVQGGLVSGLNFEYSVSQEGALVEVSSTGNSGSFNGVTAITYPDSMGTVSIAYDGTYEIVQ
jgi:hypothetical protein